MTDPETDRVTSFPEAGLRPRSPAKRIILAACIVFFFAVFAGLGIWQVQRLQWKEALIARVDKRVHADPVDAPTQNHWQQINAENSEYLHVRVTGTFLHELAAKVQASTKLGSGYWIITPLRSTNGSMVLINRGFIPQGTDASAPELRDHANGVVTVTGLLRMSEPGGGFLRNNDPAHDRWYSRDVAAIASARGLSQVAPYFIDADAKLAANNEAASLPIGGLTVISFPNSHLVYALTWFALAIMTAGAGLWVARDERRSGSSEQ